MRKIRASKCEIRNVSAKEQREFLNKNHVQGYTSCSVCIGLYLEDGLVYLQSYGTVRRDNIHYATWDMKRMCGLKDAYIYGGASKLLKYFLENYDLGKGLVTYCDPECFDGHTYEKIGFTLHHICPDDYKYVKDGIEYNKQHGKKSNIWKRLKKENPDIEPFDVWKTKHTEREMMEKLGYERVYHKGLIAYTIGTDYLYQIYKITFEDGKTYVGQHRYNKNDSNDEYVTSSVYYKSGHKVAKKEILIECKDEITMDIMETICILEDKAENGKNNVNGNLGGMMNVEWGRNAFKISAKGCIPTEETKQKISEALKGKTVSDETKEKLSIAKKAYFATEEGAAEKHNLSKRMSERVVSAETKEKISETVKKIASTEEWKKRMSESHKGHVHSEEQKKKISENCSKYIYEEISTGEKHTRREWLLLGMTDGKLRNAKKFRKLTN